MRVSISDRAIVHVHILNSYTACRSMNRNILFSSLSKFGSGNGNNSECSSSHSMSFIQAKVAIIN